MSQVDSIRRVSQHCGKLQNHFTRRIYASNFACECLRFIRNLHLLNRYKLRFSFFPLNCIYVLLIRHPAVFVRVSLYLEGAQIDRCDLRPNSLNFWRINIAVTIFVDTEACGHDGLFFFRLLNNFIRDIAVKILLVLVGDSADCVVHLYENGFRNSLGSIAVERVNPEVKSSCLVSFDDKLNLTAH